MKKKGCQVKYEKLPQDDPMTKQVIRNIINRDKNEDIKHRTTDRIT